MLALAAALTVLPGARDVMAQSTVLVSNIGQTSTSWSPFSAFDTAQRFQTGPNAAGYTLSSIELKINTGSQTATPTVKVFSRSATGTEVATLSGPSSLDANTDKNYTFTASGVTLAASTSYWVVAEGSGHPAWRNTASDNEDSGGASDWSIANVGQRRAHDNHGSFADRTDGRAYQMRINGSPIDNPPTFVSATADGTSVVITFSEDLASSSTPNSAFTVERTRNGVEATATLSNTAPVISGRTVTLTLASSAAILETDTNVKVSYAKPSNNGLEDSANSEVASFTDRPVTNRTGVPNSPAAGRPVITTPDAFRVSAVLRVDLSGIADTDGVTNIASTATYRWQRFAADGTTLDLVNIGTGSTYTPTASDLGKRIKVQVSFTDDLNFSEGPLTSDATPVIAPAVVTVDPHYVQTTLLMDLGDIRSCSSVETEAAFNIYDRGTAAENTRVNAAVSRQKIGGGLTVGRIWQPEHHADISGRSGDYCWLPENWLAPERARSPATPPRMPSRSQVEYSESPNPAASVLSDEYGYNHQGYFRRIVHSDGRETCHFNGYDGSLADIPCQ